MTSEARRGFFQPPRDEPKPSEAKKGFFQAPHDESSSSALTGLFLYSMLMFTLPLGAFYLTKKVASEEFEVPPPWDLLYAALAAVVSANLVIALYVMKAFREVKKEEDAKKDN